MTSSEPTIRCPKCRTEIKLTEAMAGPLLEAERARMTEDVARREAQLAAERASLDALVRKGAAAEVERQRREITAEYEAQHDRWVREAGDLQAQLAANERKLAEAQAAQAEAVRKGRELDDARRELELTVERRVTEAGAAIRAAAARDAEAALGVKVTERDTIIATLTRQVEELRVAAETGSTRVQGEAQEVLLERDLRARFPEDTVEAVGKFVEGADVVHRVRSLAPPAEVGTIVWESKRTKNWNDAWLAKLRQDQRDRRADLAVIVSAALPPDVETFALVDDVWVCAPRHAMTLAVVLRIVLVETAAARAVSTGQATKAELLYRYLTGPQFRQRVQAVAEKLAELREDLERERRSLSKQWAKREQALGVMAASLSGMYGDVQGLAGSAVAELDAVVLPQLED